MSPIQLHYDWAVKPFAGIALLALFALAPSDGTAQPALRKEVRAVWLTTLAGLDWPHASTRNNPKAQQAALAAIFDRLAQLNFNTVFFQVRSRGNAMYRSDLEPWAQELTGTLGKDPGWDPLAFAVTEAHRRGMEIHAWVNACKAWSGGNGLIAASPPHVARAHPEWVTPYKEEIWIDPGIPDARSYTAGVVARIAERYDIDGVHLDYIRYPEVDFDDAGTYARYGLGKEKQQWRRDNISALVKEIYDRVIAVKPWVKVGSAPIGIYKNIPGAKGWQGFSAISQDSRRWLREGYHDYVAPQIYWSLKSRGGKIDFKALALDWKAGSAGRHVYTGIAPYRPEVLSWLDEHVVAEREAGADGAVFFRYEHISGNTKLASVYNEPALVPPMPWRDNVAPNPPHSVLVAARGNAATVSWAFPAPAADGDSATRFAVYRVRQGANGESSYSLAAVLPGSATGWTDLSAGSNEYAVTSLDEFNNESAFGTTGAAPVAAARYGVPHLMELELSEPVPLTETALLLGYRIPRSGLVRVSLIDTEGNVSVVLVDGFQEGGFYVIGIDVEKLPDNIEYCKVESDGSIVVRRFAADEL